MQYKARRGLRFLEEVLKEHWGGIALVHTPTWVDTSMVDTPLHKVSAISHD